LKIVYFSNDICEWVVENLSRLTEPIMRLANYLDNNYEADADKILQAARVCVLPDDLSRFV